MRRSLITLATAVTALAWGTGVMAKQLPLMDNPIAAGKNDPSFPQPGVMRPHLGTDGEHVGGPGVEAGGGVNLADTLTLERKAALWWDYARDISAVTNRLLASGSTRSTLLVPVDSAIMRMSRKPHQNIDGSPVTDDQARTNVERFISAHIVPANVDLPTSSPVQTLLEGLSVEIKQDGNGWVVSPGDIAVASIKEASNGRILYLDKVIEY